MKHNEMNVCISVLPWQFIKKLRETEGEKYTAKLFRHMFSHQHYISQNIKTTCLMQEVQLEFLNVSCDTWHRDPFGPVGWDMGPLICQWFNIYIHIVLFTEWAVLFNGTAIK